MKTRATIPIIAVTMILSLGVFNNMKAETTGGSNTLVYNNRAYVHAIEGSPNPVVDWIVHNAEIIYVDKAYGQAIYSYPSNVSNQQTAFNMEYVDTAFGQAIYSYPNNHVMNRLELTDNTMIPGNDFIVPATLKIRLH